MVARGLLRRKTLPRLLPVGGTFLLLAALTRRLIAGFGDPGSTAPGLEAVAGAARFGLARYAALAALAVLAFLVGRKLTASHAYHATSERIALGAAVGLGAPSRMAWGSTGAKAVLRSRPPAQGATPATTSGDACRRWSRPATSGLFSQSGRRVGGV